MSVFEFGALSWIILSLGCLALALLGLFYAPVLLLWLLVVVGTSAMLVKNKKIVFEYLKINEFILLGSLCLFAFGLSIYTTPTIFGGRDEGSFSNSAIMLSTDHSLSHQDALAKEFFGIYGPGKAYNFPGFNYSQNGELVSQFLPGFPSWVGFWYSLLGEFGIKFANFFPYVTFIFSFFLVLKRFVGNEKFAYWGTVIMATTLPAVLFYKFTLTEIFFASLLWLSLHFLLKYLKDRSYQKYVAIFIPMILASFVRIETLGIAFALVLIIIGADFAHAKIPRYQLMFFALGLSMAISFFASPHFYVDSIKNAFEFTLPQTSSQVQPGSSSILPDDWQGFYLIKVFFNYNILPLLLIGGTMIVLVVRKKRWKMLYPFFLLSPTLIYLVDANISLDHPWMLRRFLFSIIPLFLLYTMFLLYNLSSKFPKVALTVIIFIFALDLLQTSQFVLASQNRGLMDQANSITQNFNSNDLLLFSRNSSGSGWSLISEPLRNINERHAVYFFNPNDLAKIDLQKFGSVYLFTSNEELELYKNLPAQQVGQYSITNSIVHSSLDPLSVPKMERYEVEGTIFQISKQDNGTN